MNASEGIQFIKAVKELGIREEAAEKIVSLVESQRGELATKADIERLEEGQKRLEEGQKEQREQSRKEIEQAEKRLEAGIRTNRWIFGLVLPVTVAIMIGGFGMYISSHIEEMQANIRELRQSQQSEKQAERTGNSARPS